MQTAAPILDALDRYNFFLTHRLYREATRSTKDGVVKVCFSPSPARLLDALQDLSYLNRDLSKVVVLDTDKNVTRLQPGVCNVPSLFPFSLFHQITPLSYQNGMGTPKIAV